MTATSQLPSRIAFGSRATRYATHVPQERLANLLYREELLKWAGADPERQFDLIQMCREDICFFASIFVFVHEPRPDIWESGTLPFTCFDFHWWLLPTLAKLAGRSDLLTEKSRDMTATWTYLICFLHRWLFYESQSFLMISRKEELVEKRDDPKALFSRLDFIIKHLPSWMLPAMTRTDRHLGNDDNGSSIDGETTSGDVGAGDRRTAVLLDEFARVPLGEQTRVLGAITSVTDSRFINSSHQGTNTAYYRLSQDPAIPKIQLHWALHPRKRKGLYTSKGDGTLVIKDRKYRFPRKPDGMLCSYVEYHPPRMEKGQLVQPPPTYFDFVLDGKERSPWYDKECNRLIYASLIASELDMNPQGSVARVFPEELVETCRAGCRAPVTRGRLRFGSMHGEVEEWVADERGKLALWFDPGANAVPPPDRSFIIGCDVAAGTGASNSVAKVYDRASGEQVGEYVDPHIAPESFATLMKAACEWFHNAFLIWEANGHGEAFGNRILELGYRNIYYRQDEDRRGKKTSDRPGWYSTRKTKRILLTEYRFALEQGKIIERSTDTLDELEEYIHGPQGEMLHSGSLLKEDPSGAGENHGDRCIAGAVACLGMQRRPVVERGETDRDPPAGSLAWRMMLAEQEEYALEEAWVE